MISDVLSAFSDGLKRVGDGWTARCPAHDDRKASLSIAAKDGKVLIHCHAGCATADILAGVNLTARDLFEGEAEDRGQRIAAEYNYRDRGGQVLFQVVRFYPKGFRQRRPAPGGGWTWGLGDVDRVLYRLPELDHAPKDATVFVVEGEKDADRLAALGLVATCNMGGAGKGKWRHEYSQALAGRTVVILPDNDEVGRDHAETIVKALDGVAASVKLVDLPDLRPKGDVSDWFDAGRTAEDLLALAAGDQAQPWPDPVPLIPAVPPFPTDCLASAFSEIVKATGGDLQVPEDMVAMYVLAAIALCCAKRIKVEVRQGHVEAVNLYVAVVAEVGELKTPTARRIEAPLHEYEAEEAERLAPEVARKRSDLEALEKRKEELQRQAAKADDETERRTLLSDAAELAAQLASTPRPTTPKLLEDDVTPERLARVMYENGERIAIMTAEGGQVFSMMDGLYSKESNLGVYLKAHAGDPFKISRQGSTDVRMSEPALTLGLMMQPEVIRELRDRRGFRGKGVHARFLYSYPVSRVGYRGQNPPTVPEAVTAAYARAIRALLRLRPGPDGSPTLLRFSPGARDVFKTFCAGLEVRKRPAGDLRHIGDWANKLTGHVARIAGLLHAARCASDAQPVSGVISEQTVRDAVRIGEYLISHALTTFAEMQVDAPTRQARQILAWVKDKSLDVFSAADAWQYVHHYFPGGRQEMEPALRRLEENGYIRPERMPDKGGPGRKPSQRYAVNPAIHSGFQEIAHAVPDETQEGANPEILNETASATDAQGPGLAPQRINSAAIDGGANGRVRF